MFCILSRAEVLFRNPPLVYTSELCFVLANIYLITFISFLILSFNYFLWCLVNKGKNHFYKGYHLWLFICWKTKLKKKHFFLKKYMLFTKYTLFAEKNVFIWKKKFYIEIFLLKKTFFTEKNINENVKIYIYISIGKYIFMQNMFVLRIKYKSFLNIYSFCKSLFFDHQKYIC